MQKMKNIIIILAIALVCETALLIKAKIDVRKHYDANALNQTISKGIDNVYIQVRIKKETKDGIFTDSLYYPSDEWSRKTTEEIKQVIQTRVDNWAKVTSGNSQ